MGCISNFMCVVGNSNALGVSNAEYIKTVNNPGKTERYRRDY